MRSEPSPCRRRPRGSGSGTAPRDVTQRSARPRRTPCKRAPRSSGTRRTSCDMRPAPPPSSWIALLAVVGCLALASGARADDASANKKLATDLFDRGVRKLREGHCDKAPVGDRPTREEARDALKRAYDLYPEGLGAL